MFILCCGVGGGGCVVSATCDAFEESTQDKRYGCISIDVTIGISEASRLRLLSGWFGGVRRSLHLSPGLPGPLLKLGLFPVEGLIISPCFNSGVKVSPQNDNLVYTASLDQTIKLWDLRSGPSLKPVLTFAEEKTSNSRPGKEKPLTAFDVNCADRFIAAGTEQVLF